MSKKYVLKSAPSASASSIDYDAELNPAQVQVVREGDGPCLVLAGAGSGKTRTLIYRVAYLLEKDVRPEEILLVTFTNKAASEMRSRVEALLKSGAKGLWCGTFHHIGNRLLRMHGDEIGLPREFGILDEEDSRDLLKNCIASAGTSADSARFPKPAAVSNVLSYAVNARLSIAEAVERHAPHFIGFTRDFEKIRAAYDDKKRRTNNLDYDDLLLRWLELLERSPRVREKLTNQFRYVLVDEYQDTNRLQHAVIRILAEKHKNLLVVGDDAQSIYSFRAAEIKNILEFPETYPGARVFKLETNYRSTRPILDLANHSIANNVRQFPKKLKSVAEEGTLPQVVKLRDPRQQATFIAQRILELTESGLELSDIAVLFRAHYQAAELEMELAKRGVPYLVRGGVRFFEQAHIKDVLAHLRLVSNPLDEIAWARALTLQAGIGAGWAAKIFAAFEKAGGDLNAAAAPAFGDAFPPKVREGFRSFQKILKNLLRDDGESHPDALVEAVLENGYNKHVLLHFENAQDRLEDLRELVSFAHTYKNLKTFLADSTLREGFKGETILEAGEQKNAPAELVLSTIHQAKGLEWRAVFVIGLSEGLFPHARSMQFEREIEEERRLFYVASTRAKEELVLTQPMTRWDHQAGTVILRPSIFLQELPSDDYEELEIEESDEEKTIYLDD